MSVDLREKLRRLSSTPGVSGFEEPIRAVVREEFAALGGEVSEDRLGNVIALKRGEGVGPHPKVLVAAHLDEIGLIVTAVEEDGFLRFIPVGGVDPRVLVAQEVVVHGHHRPLPGVIGAKPPHVQDEDESKLAYPLDKLYIDVGLPPARAREEVRIGDPVTLKGGFVSLAGDRVAGKAFDDRAGVAALFVCLAELGRRSHRADVYLVATVGEETGYRGATTAAFALAPDVAVAVDANFAEEQPIRIASELGKGPALSIGPPCHPKLCAHFEAVAREVGLPYQLDPEPQPKGTDAYALQVARAGVPTLLVSVPVKSMHTVVEVTTIGDVEATGRLLAEALARLEPELVEGWQCL